MVEGETCLRLAAARKALGTPAPDLLERGLDRLADSAAGTSEYEAWFAFYGRESLSHAELRELAASSIEAHVARLALERFVDANETPPPAALRVAPDGAWIELLDGTKKWFRGSSPMRNVLRALASARIEEPGRVLDTKTLISHGWPGEKMTFKSAQGRLWVTIRRLRQLGLDDTLEQIGPGYRISPNTLLEFAETDL